MTDLKQLLPCPFCGREVEVRNGYIAHPHGDCAAAHIVLNHNAAGIEAWNTRTLSEENRRLRGAVAALAGGAEKLGGSPFYIVQPFLNIYREHGETIAAARTALHAEGERE
jgi:hypothetical protein